MTPGPRVTILGCGALGCLMAARLGRTLRVTVGGTWAAGLDALARRGARIDGEPAVPVTARRLSELDEPADLVLVVVKAGQTADVAPVAAHLLAPGGAIVTLQNGLGLRELLAQAAGPDRVTAGVTTVGATLLSPGLVRAFPGHVVLEAHPAPAVRALADALVQSGLPTDVVPDLEPHVWRKLAVNCALNAVTAVLDVTNGAVLDDPAARALVEAAAREVAAVARARGITLAGDPAVDALSVARRTAGNRSSMLQDLARHAATEIEFLNGAVEREGRRLGVPTPVNAQLARQVRELAAARLQKALS
jgi:2-dehydropantoate 2-reductase